MATTATTPTAAAIKFVRPLVLPIVAPYLGPLSDDFFCDFRVLDLGTFRSTIFFQVSQIYAEEVCQTTKLDVTGPTPNTLSLRVCLLKTAQSRH